MTTGDSKLVALAALAALSVGCSPAERVCAIDDDCEVTERCEEARCAPLPPPPLIVDAGRPPAEDAGPPAPGDAGALDGGAPVDAGPPIDAGPVASCAEILARSPGVVTGLYEINVDGTPRTVVCEMTLEGGGWTQVVDLDFPAGDACPGDWTAEAEIAGCRRPADGIATATFDSPLASYDEVLGRAVGRQKGSPDAFGTPTAIDETYVDGLSLTARDAAGARVHIYSFAVGLTETPGQEDQNRCPCDEGSTNAVPGFVGTDFLCDTGGTGLPDGNAPWQPEDLWDEDSFEGTCGGLGAPTYFRRALAEPASSAIEARLGADQGQANEDVGVRVLELYVR